ncbi:MAG: hypothetical protein QOE29_2399 [Gaiellaceae bacterium]|jgi:hypothetical protein|nr:hypothetical protein [Gaiellaceae bacterium]
MYARMATFQGDPAKLDESIAMVRGEVESGSPPPGLEGTKMMMFVDRKTGKGIGITLFESEEAMQRGHEALEAMSPGSGAQRTAVEFYDVPVSRLG